MKSLQAFAMGFASKRRLLSAKRLGQYLCFRPSGEVVKWTLVWNRKPGVSPPEKESDKPTENI